MPTALITGATSGIGLHFAQRLATDGYDLVLVARSRENLQELAETLHHEHAVHCEVLRADLGRLSDCRRVENRLADRPVDLLVNNAGLGLYEGDFVEHDLAAEDNLLMVNVRAVLRLTHAALGPMLERGEGAIINVSSVASFAPDPNAPTYAASKAWVTSFTEGLRAQISGSGVQLLALTPGLVPTRFQERAGAQVRVPAPFWLDADEVVGTALRDLRAGRGISVPGMAYRAIRVAMQFTPRRVYLPLSGTLQKRFT